MSAGGLWWRYTEQGIVECDHFGNIEAKPWLTAHLAFTQNSIEVLDKEVVASICWKYRDSPAAFIDALDDHLKRHRPDDDCARNSNQGTIEYLRTLPENEVWVWTLMSVLRGERSKAERDRFARKAGRAETHNAKHWRVVDMCEEIRLEHLRARKRPSSAKDLIRSAIVRLRADGDIDFQRNVSIDSIVNSVYRTKPIIEPYRNALAEDARLAMNKSETLK